MKGKYKIYVSFLGSTIDVFAGVTPFSHKERNTDRWIFFLVLNRSFIGYERINLRKKKRRNKSLSKWLGTLEKSLKLRKQMNIKIFGS